MYKFKFDTTKMSWNKTEMGASTFKLLGLSINVTDNDYFNNTFWPLIKSIVNVDFKFVIVEKSPDKYTWIANPVKIVGLDMVNQVHRDNPTGSNISIECLIREQQDRISDIGNYEIYLIYS